MLKFLKSLFSSKYATHDEAIIISCYFNPQNSLYRIKAFNHFYNSIKHMNHQIIECVIGDAKPHLKESENIKRVYTESLLWHKETLLNKIISELPRKYKYIFWIDADVIFTNKNWLTDSVKEFERGVNILQPFEYCVHLDKDQLKPEFDLEFAKSMYDPKGSIVQRSKRLWRSFCSNWVTNKTHACSENYDVHGHVGFAWAARRDILEKVPLYDKALIGGADHIIAHAAAGQIGHKCITKSFTDDIDEVLSWSRDFFTFVKGKIGYVKGDLFHIWHGDIDKRDYFNRIVNFTSKAKNISMRDENGLFVTKDKESIKYMKNYFKQREVEHKKITHNQSNINKNDYYNNNYHNDGFWESYMYGYLFNDGMMGGVMGGNFAGGMMGDMMNNSEEEQTRHNLNENKNSNDVNISDDHDHKHNHSNDNDSLNINSNNNVNEINSDNNSHDNGHHHHSHDHSHHSNNDYSGSTFS